MYVVRIVSLIVSRMLIMYDAFINATTVVGSIHEGNTEDENNGYVVFKRNTHGSAKLGGG